MARDGGMRHVARIDHITTAEAWEAARLSGRVEAPSLATQGYVHGSDAGTLLRVAEGIFRGRTGLVLLAIDPARVTAEIRRESLEGGPTLFPHVYGPIPLGAVVSAAAFPQRPDGTFAWPEDLPREEP
jgi:uncharacterized protein (DUF952 family)